MSDIPSQAFHSRSRTRALPLPFLAFVVASALVALPILAHPYLPLVDLPNHIARLHIAAHGDGPLSAFYEYSFRIVPNSAADLIWALLGHPGDAARFAQVSFALYAAGTVGATMVLARQIHGRWTIWSAASALVVYNACFYWGFQNYLISVPVAIAGFAMALATENRRMWQRLALFIPFAFCLFLMHFFAFAALALLVLGRELQCVATAGRGTRIGVFLRRIPIAIPYVLPAGWLAANVLTAPAGVQGAMTAFGPVSARLEALISPALVADPWLGPATIGTGWIVLAFLLVAAFFLFRRRGARLVVAPLAIGPAIAILTVGLLAPYWLNGVALIHLRLPFVGLLVVFAATDWCGLSRRSAVMLSLVVAAILGARAASFEAASRRYSQDVADFLAVTEALPPAARLLPLRTRGKSLDRRLWHIDAFAVARRDAFSPLLFQGVHQLDIRPALLESAHPQLFPLGLRHAHRALETGVEEPVFLQDWDEKFTYAILLDPLDETAAADAAALPMLHRVAQQGRFTLYRIGAL
ncbi:hypothetical protein [Tropicimonas marinistellae]|uniref:hypothetical protein n=1 Tax=Tropicimonas marinistellae TaxID=1739787 RepID=UPI00082A9E44|nr:hypothetical protein [Tropicimonas marinistellae]